MKYQLIIQWADSTMLTYDDLIDVENALLNGLPASADVDGHDVGPDEANIFVRTDDPIGTFENIKALLQPHEYWQDARMAYRAVDGAEYTILWPPGLHHFKVS